VRNEISDVIAGKAGTYWNWFLTINTISIRMAIQELIDIAKAFTPQNGVH
jgi:hypothetical protein